MRYEKHRKKSKRIVTAVLTVCLVAQSLAVSIPAYAFTTIVNDNAQLNWTGNSIQVDVGRNGFTEGQGGDMYLRDLDQMALTIEPSATFNAQPSASGELNALSIVDNTYFHVESGANVTVYNISNESGGGAVEPKCGLSVQSGATLNCYSVTNTSGALAKLYGTVNVRDGLSNAGTIMASDFTWKSIYTNTGTVEVSDSLTFDSSCTGTVGGTFSVDEDTLITSTDDVTFTLKLGSNTYTINEELDGKPASWVVKTTPTFGSYDSFRKFFYGVSYTKADFDGVFFTNSDAAIQYSFEKNGVISDTVPTSVGEFTLHAHVDETSTYRDGDVSMKKNIVYLTDSDDAAVADGCVITDTPVIDDGTALYFNAPVSYAAPEGFGVLDSDGASADFAGTYTVGDDGYYESFSGVLRKESNGARTAYAELNTEKFFIDQTPPEVEAGSVMDQDGNVLEDGFENGTEFHAKWVEFDIYDEFYEYAPEHSLASVTVNGETVTIADGRGHVKLTTAKSEEDFHIVAKDALGNTFDRTVTLEYEKDVSTASISMDDQICYTDYADPAVTTDSDQDPSEYIFSYKKKGASDDTYTTDKPILPGEYEVRLQIPASAHWTAVSAKTGFKIKYLSAPSEAYTLEGTKGNNGYYTSDVKVAAPEGYRITDEEDGEFTDSVSYRDSLEKIWLMRIEDGARTDAIPFSERLLIDQTRPAFSESAVDHNGNTVSLTHGMEIHTKSLAFDVTDDNLLAVSVNGESVDVSDGSASVTLDVYDESRTFVILAEDKAGNRNSLTVTVEYIKRVPVTSISMPDALFGAALHPEVSSDSDGEMQLYYKYASEEESAYTTVVPSAVGAYTVQVRYSATGECAASVAEDDFNIAYMPVPEETAVIKGVSGNGDYYTSDVEIIAPGGYSISDRIDGSYSPSLTYATGMTVYYLRRDTDGALTDAIPIGKQILVDKVLPGAKGTALTQANAPIVLEDGLNIFADTLSFTIADDHLARVTVQMAGSQDVTELAVVSGEARVKLDSQKTASVFTVTAEDDAGNIITYHITLVATWLETRVVLEGTPLPLVPGESYTLEEGEWLVNGDATTYFGGRVFYVGNPGDYTFTSK